ncbi:MAG TPA: hypothetical protein VNA88_12230 [Candidatus Kapabacteria bacterium]|nr:hypothetical protein [Candidatus Kapabacteria bacterium]
MLHTPLPRLGSILSLALATMLGVAGCSDEPTPVGSDYLPETVSFSSYVVGAAEMEILSGSPSLSNATSKGGTTVLVGSAADGTTAHGLLVLTDPIRALEGSNPREVTAVSLRFRTLPYRYGDLSSKQSEFDVVAIDESALDTLRWSPALVAKIAAAPSLGTYSGVLPDSAVVTITLEKDAATAFLKSYYASDTTISTTDGKADTIITTRTLKSLALRARTGSTVVASMLGATYTDVADSLRPALVVTMGDSTATLLFGVASWIADLPEQPGANTLMVAGGEPIRTFIQVRPEGLPLAATIHQARLVLHVDTARSKRGTSEPISYVVLYDADAGARTSFMPLSVGRLMSGFRQAEDTARFRDIFEINGLAPALTSAVRARRREGETAVAPFVLALGRGSGGRADQESGTVDRLYFHGFDAPDSALHPKLTIIYSTQNDAP